MHIRNSLALVTGASSGIGAASALALARRGAQVILVARSRPGLEAAAEAIRREGGIAHVYVGDLGEAGTVEGLHRRWVAEVGHPDIVVNSAGAGRWLFTEETEPLEMVQMMAAPYYCAFYVTRQCLPEMLRRRRGHIVNVNSPVARGAWPGAAGYTAVRYALHGFTNALRLDLLGTGVGVSSVTPGKTESGYFAHNPGVLERAPGVSRLIPSVTPDQVGSAVAQAIERNRREVVLPFMLQVFFALNQATPWLMEWLLVRTGWRRRPA